MKPHTPFQPPRYDARWVLSDSRARSMAKAISWRITGSFATFLIAWLIGGNVTVAGTIAVVQIIANTILYYFHERLWNLLTWGR